MKAINDFFAIMIGGAKNSVIQDSKNSRRRLGDNDIANDRRDYGMGVSLWDDRDPRADQSFFLGGVPSFILSADQKILDWNEAFNIAFDANKTMKKGMPVSGWYSRIDNFRRLPERESKLFGDALLPITDRERVVYLSPKYGRMVFMKIMTPVIDRINGRIIGWSITLNVNSVSSRLSFFEDLFAAIERTSKHARYVLGLQILAERSHIFSLFYQRAAKVFEGSSRSLIIGSIHAPGVIRHALSKNPNLQLTVLDTDTESLRALKQKLGVFRKRVKIVRKELEAIQLDSLQQHFDSVVILHPEKSHIETKAIYTHVSNGLGMPVHVVTYPNQITNKEWWNQVKLELEDAKEFDVLKWHWPLLAEIETKED